MWKIAVSGAQGSGKTTLANELDKALECEGYAGYVIQEAARDCPHPIDVAGTIQSQEWMFFEHMRREFLVNKADIDYVVVDRTLLESLVYAKWIILRDNLGSLVRERFEGMYRAAVCWMSTYDGIYQLPLNEAYLKKRDGECVDLDYARWIDVELQRYVPLNGIKFDFERACPTLLGKTKKNG